LYSQKFLYSMLNCDYKLKFSNCLDYLHMYSCNSQDVNNGTIRWLLQDSSFELYGSIISDEVRRYFDVYLTMMESRFSADTISSRARNMITSSNDNILLKTVQSIMAVEYCHIAFELFGLITRHPIARKYGSAGESVLLAYGIYILITEKQLIACIDAYGLYDLHAGVVVIDDSPILLNSSSTGLGCTLIDGDLFPAIKALVSDVDACSCLSLDFSVATFKHFVVNVLNDEYTPAMIKYEVCSRGLGIPQSRVDSGLVDRLTSHVEKYVVERQSYWNSYLQDDSGYDTVFGSAVCQLGESSNYNSSNAGREFDSNVHVYGIIKLFKLCLHDRVNVTLIDLQNKVDSVEFKQWNVLVESRFIPPFDFSIGVSLSRIVFDRDGFCGWSRNYGIGMIKCEYWPIDSGLVNLSVMCDGDIYCKCYACSRKITDVKCDNRCSCCSVLLSDLYKEFVVGVTADGIGVGDMKELMSSSDVFIFVDELFVCGQRIPGYLLDGFSSVVDFVNFHKFQQFYNLYWYPGNSRVVKDDRYYSVSSWGEYYDYMRDNGRKFRYYWLLLRCDQHNSNAFNKLPRELLLKVFEYARFIESFSKGVVSNQRYCIGQ
jgi:hypothetical protein